MASSFGVANNRLGDKRKKKVWLSHPSSGRSKIILLNKFGIKKEALQGVRPIHFAMFSLYCLFFSGGAWRWNESEAGNKKVLSPGKIVNGVVKQ